MAVPNNAYLFGGTATFPLHLEGETKLDCYPALFLPEHGNYIKERFFLDALLVVDNEQGDKAFLGMVEYASANWFMHSQSRKSKGMLSKEGLAQPYTILNDAGLNTLGLPQYVSREGNAVNYIEFTVALLQPWYGTVTSFEIEFWAGGSRVTSMTIDLANFIPNYDFGGLLDAYSPALDITRARAYKVLLMPALDVAALNNMSYDLRYIIGDEFSNKQQLKTMDFPLTGPVSVLSLKERPLGDCDTSTEISKRLFTKIERAKILPGLPEPARIVYREPDGRFAWCSQDINDLYTVFYEDTELSVRANGWFSGAWGNYIVQITNGLQGQRLDCQPAPVVPPRDISRYGVSIDSVSVIGSNATVKYTVSRDLSGGGDPSMVSVMVSIDDGVGSTTGGVLLDDYVTSEQGTIKHKIKNPSYGGLSGSIVQLSWPV